MKSLKTVLHVDDDKDIREIARIAMEIVGDLTVLQCASGKAALDAAPAFQPDLFLLDVMMPELSGEETWAQLRRLPGMSEVPAIFMTAKAQESVADKLIELGAIAVITKPFDPMELCMQIRTAWTSQR